MLVHLTFVLKVPDAICNCKFALDIVYVRAAGEPSVVLLLITATVPPDFAATTSMNPAPASLLP
jgi:hypothetical protein